MKILILGGTVFVGRHLVASALARGHKVTIFNRGRTHPELFAEVEKLRGDRDRDLSALRGRSFDAVIDPSGYRPEQVRTVIDALGDGIAHYTFISSISAYQEFPPGQPYDEHSLLAQGREGYGPLKARTEEELETALAQRIACVRPGLIVGPHDPTDRFTYWPRRISQGGHVLAPGRPERPIQFIDVRDLADWCVSLAETRRVGRFNAIGPKSLLTMKKFLDSCCAVTSMYPRITWVSDEALLAAGIKPWTELPLWIPENDPRSGGVMLGNNQNAVAAGLSFRPVSETIRATLQWHNQEGGAPSGPLRVSPISREREAAITASNQGMLTTPEA